MVKNLHAKEVSFIWDILNEIPDPEIPVISLVELGVVRGVEWVDTQLQITITPTYSGCPAMRMMEMDIDQSLRKEGILDFKINRQYHPAWTTDWMSESTKSKLKTYGIAPPQAHTKQRIGALISDAPTEVPCPQCNSVNTKLIIEFGSTACKSLMKCNDCLEAFDYFKCI